MGPSSAPSSGRKRSLCGRYEQQAGTDIHMRPLVEVKAGAAATSGSHIRDRVLRQAGRLDPAIELLTDDLRAGQALRERRTRADPDVGLRARRHPYPGWARLDDSVCGSFRPLEMAVDR